jgi:Flp pilus assembly pilin Flp
MLKLITKAQARLNSLRDEQGATATEYALIIGVASIAIVGTLWALSPLIETFIDTVVAPELGVAAE